MIRRMSHATIYVLDQDSAKDFYVDKLGFELYGDEAFGEGQRWLTVGPKGQPDLVFTLMAVAEGPHLPKEKVEVLRELVESHTFGIGVLETDDARKEYETLSAKGVEFVRPPEEQFYGIEALFRDDSGNWFSLTQRTTS